MKECLQKDYRGRFYEDFYRYLLHSMQTIRHKLNTILSDIYSNHMYWGNAPYDMEDLYTYYTKKNTNY